MGKSGPDIVTREQRKEAVDYKTAAVDNVIDIRESSPGTVVTTRQL